jgi:hypothetical protein
MFVVYLPPLNGKLAGWLRNTIWTTYADRASTFATREDAEAAMAKAAQFHLKRVMKAARITDAAERWS